MAHTVDVDGTEEELLARQAAFDGARVLEIGCGDGRATKRYARRARSVLAIDPKAQSIAEAIASLPADLAAVVQFEVGDARHVPRRPASFDVVFFSHSL